MSAEVQSGYAAFQPLARLLKLIGAELISDDVVAITELVKNAHDADASYVKITFSNVTETGGEIVIADDGFGMDRETLLHGWMEPAGSTKVGAGRRVTPRGRRVLGEKGLGRFAADKLGSRLELISRREGSGAEVCAHFDWDQFDNPTQMLGEIQARWELRPARELTSHGTVLRISGLRAVWTERMFRRLTNRLARLRSPFRERNDFAIHIESDAFPEYSGELASGFLDKAPYQIDVSFNGEDSLKISANGSSWGIRPWSGTGPLTCGPVRVRLYAFDLETEAVARIGPRMEVRAWLREWSGVSVYRDGFRLWPYGEAHDDWLRLDQRRVNNPVVKLSNNQVVGFVEISGDGNPELKDQTNREGMVNTQAFADLRRLIDHIFQLLESERQTIRHPPQPVPASARKARKATTGEPLLANIEKIAGRTDVMVGHELRRVAEQLREKAVRDQQQQRRVVEGYSDLAAIGQAALGLSTEVAAALESSRSTVAELRQLLKGTSGVATPIKALEKSLSRIDERLALVAALEGGTMRRRRTIEVPAELEAFKSLFEPLLAERHIEMRIHKPDKGLLRVDMNPQSFRRILHILTVNSMDWLHGVSRPRIDIVAKAQEDHCLIEFLDNGPGIVPELAERVFEPMFSQKEGGSGMGLTIARNIVTLHAGTIEVFGKRKGAHVHMRLPRKRSRSTVR